jgi:uncharacterized damage-inducible protein DinB
MKNRAQPQNAECLFTRYKAWADAIFLSVVSELPPQELTAPRPIGFGSLIRTLNHSYCMDVVWRAHLLGRPHGLTTRNPASIPPSMRWSRPSKASMLGTSTTPRPCPAPTSPRSSNSPSSAGGKAP